MPSKAIRKDPPSRRGRRYSYLLGDSKREAARLRAQARLWDPHSRALLDRLQVRRGWKVLEIGPGMGSLHLELRRRVKGPVDAVERSAAFADRLEAACARDGLGAGRIWRTDLLDAPLPRGRYDLIFVRWVFLFLPRPEAHMKTLARALKPGGLLAIQDYFRENWALIPPSPDWTDFRAADRAFFASEGADGNIGGQLPGLYRRAGLDLLEVTPILKFGHPGSPVWNWVFNYFVSVMDRYAAIPPFSRAKARRLHRHWAAAARNPESLLLAPAVLDVVGRKPRRRRS